MRGKSCLFGYLQGGGVVCTSSFQSFSLDCWSLVLLFLAGISLIHRLGNLWYVHISSLLH